MATDARDLIAQELGRRLRNARERQKLSRYEVAQQVGIREQSLYRYERGENIPGTDVLVYLLWTLGLEEESISDLLPLEWGPPSGPPRLRLVEADEPQEDDDTATDDGYDDPKREYLNPVSDLRERLAS